MEEFKGTKGEWEAHFGETIGVASKNPLRIIADVELDKDIPEDEQRANAKLIAAAPELLEMLQKMNTWCKTLADWSNNNASEMDPPIIEAQLIIDKALGK